MTNCLWPNACDCFNCAKAGLPAQTAPISMWDLPKTEQLFRIHAELDELIEAYRPVRLVVGSAALRAMADEALEDEMRRSLKP